MVNVSTSLSPIVEPTCKEILHYGSLLCQRKVKFPNVDITRGASVTCKKCGELLPSAVVAF